jgi:hypothetical protein
MFVDTGLCLLASGWQRPPLLSPLFWLSAIMSQYLKIVLNSIRELAASSTLKIEATWSSKTSVDFQRTIWYHVREEFFITTPEITLNLNHVFPLFFILGIDWMLN